MLVYELYSPTVILRILTGQLHFSRSPVKEIIEINVKWNANLVDSRPLFP
jgi:hypothetical protein